ncbi:glycosyl transferase family 2 [Arthrobacter crystallopoietes BAB-32]|uniref:Glycosyl transferase family 2 n=1 Tax=Arthrobacter crystallopoietes BAB-32 TaxID=1246476 RepID=N1V309_9MICC|nr:glycosyltransferase family 2 protein [Arthrobacter crystallopoietes]EMY34379.1 glycosyl transferase family 2 [Arthrobacter crystallopoietes BAB-32]
MPATSSLTPLEENPGVSYIMPILNEAAHIEDAVRSILAQDYPGPKEIVLALGPSTDGTNEIVGRLQAGEPRLRSVTSPTGRTPAGLNLALDASRYPVIIRVDAHTELEPHYTARGVATLRRTGAADVGGLMDAQGRTPFQRAVAAAYVSPLGLGGAAYHSGAPEGPAESAYLGVFRREALDAVGHFEETLWRGQDWDMCLRLRQAGYDVWFDPGLKVTYWPRSSWSKLVRQFYAAGIWRAELARRHKEGKSVRHFIPPLLVGGLAAGTAAGALTISGATRSWPAWLKLPAAAAALLPAFYAAGVAGTSATAKADLTASERLLLCIVLPSIHVSWGLGYLRGRLLGAAGTVDTSRRKS